MAEESSWWEDAWGYVTDTESGLVGDVTDFFTTSSGGLDTNKIAGLVTGVGSVADAFGLLPDTTPKTGYQGKIPTYTVAREQVPSTYDPNRRPGSGGQRYFTDTRFVAPDQVEPTRAELQQQATGLEAINLANLARQERPAPRVPSGEAPSTATTPTPASQVVDNLPVPAQTQGLENYAPTYRSGGIARLQGGGTPAQAPQTPMSRQDLIGLYETDPRKALGMVMSGQVGGKPQSMSYARTYLEMLKKAQQGGQLPSQQAPQPTPQMGAGTGMAQGGIASVQPKGYYLGGTTDGMADKVPATIDNQQPAALSDGEFVIPADVVSHLGNGNSNAGAKQLYSMMDNIRQARTGNKQQGKQVNPNKFMPA